MITNRNMENDAPLRIWLDRNEQMLIEKLNQGEIPFLGGYLDFFNDNSKSYLKKKLVNSQSPMQPFLRGFRKWPAVFAAYFTIYVVESYGKDRDAAVWPYIGKAIASANEAETINQPERKALWATYRAACIKIGLPVLSRKSGNLYMVREFLHQAGVPLEHLGKLAGCMIKYADSYGLPEERDPSAVKQWRLGLLDFIGNSVPKPVISALEADDTDYYPYIFLKFHASGSDSAKNQLEKKFFNGLSISQKESNLSSRESGTFQTPTALWLDDHICIELPADEDDEWEIKEADKSTYHTGLPEKQIIPIVTELPCNIEVINTVKHQKLILPLWENSDNNRFLLIDAQGKLTTGGSLAEDTLHIDPGEYQVLSRFTPKEYNEDCIEEISSYPKIYLFDINLAPGGEVSLSRGPASIKLQADSKPLVTWRGNKLKEVRGHEFFSSEDLSIQIQIPAELKEAANLIVQLDPGNSCFGEAFYYPTEFSENATLTSISLYSTCTQWEAGLIRLSATLRREDSNRVVARSSIYLWNGLNKANQPHQLSFTRPPINFNEPCSDNIKRSEFHLTYKDNRNRFFRTTFDFNNKTEKQISFTWPVPGIFQYLEKQTESGIKELPIEKNTSISVAATSRDTLKVFSDTSGSIHLGSFSRHYNFIRSRYKRIPLSSLIEYITPDDNLLRFRADDCKESEILLQINSPQHVLGFEQNSNNTEAYQIHFMLMEFAEELEVSAVDLLAGTIITKRLTANNPDDILLARNPQSFSNTLDTYGRAKHTLHISLSNWKTGAWLLNFKVRIDNRWYVLSNPRGDTFSTGFMFSDGLTYSVKVFLNRLPSLSQRELLTGFKQASTALLECYAEESWEELKWVKDLWLGLGERLDIDHKQTLIELMRLSTKRPITSDFSGWVPLCSTSAHFIEIYSLPANHYQILSSENHSALRILALISSLNGNLTEFFIRGIIYQTAAAGFSNFQDMQRGKAPLDFILSHYKQALSIKNLDKRSRLLNQEDWQPGEGHYLGELHYYYTINKLKENYRLTLGGRTTENHVGNHWRRGHSLNLLKKMRRFTLSDFATGVPAHWAKSDVTNLGLLKTEVNNEDEQEVENLRLIVGGLSLLAQICRWESRSKGSLSRFKEQSKQMLEINDEQLELILGYLLFIGEEIFSFYLLLWEFVTAAQENK